MSLKSLTRQNYVNKSIQNSIAPTGTGVAAPVITSIIICDSNYNNLDDTALSPSGSYVKLIGTGFKTGCTVYFNNESLTATFVSGTEVRIQTPATTVGAYNIMLFNPNNAGGAIYLNLSVSNFPTYTTSAGSLGSYYEANTISNTIVATGDTPLSYSLYSGSLPDGATLNSDGTITGTSPAESGSTTYSFVVNVKDAQGQDATRSFSLTINTDPVTWSSPNNNQVISAYEYAPISNVTLSATTAAGKAITYSANALPGGITLNDSTISGTNNVVGNTYTRLTATAATTGRTATRDVVFNVNQDVVTWSSPADATAYTLAGGSAMANVTLSATSAAGRTISYTANALPSGLNLSDNTIYGTPDTSQTVYTLLTATAETTNRSATRTISWTISLGDTYWKYNTLLLSADNTVQTSSFVSDNSINNQQLTVVGDTRASNFNPYQQGYYSNYFNGTTDYLSIPSSSAFSIPTTTTPFTIEAWVYRTSSGGCVFSESFTGSGSIAMVVMFDNGSVNTPSGDLLTLAYYNGSSWVKQAASSSSVALNTWVHIACVFTGSATKIFVNGIDVTAAGALTTWEQTGISGDAWYIGRRWDTSAPGVYFPGYISNFRFVKGTAMYLSNFTPSTTPLLPVTNTVLLTCQSNRLIDNSVNNFTITKNGDTKVSSAHPFSTVYQAGAQYYSTSFNGSTDYLTLPTNTGYDFGTGDFTIECWINPSAIASNRVFMSTQSSGTASAGWSLFLFSTGYIGFDVFDGSEKYVTCSTTQLTAGNWYHVAFTRQSGTLRIFVNGVSQTFSGTQASSINSAVGLTIGRQQQAGYEYAFAGLISNARVVKGTSLYNSGFTPSTSPLTAVSGTTALTCQDSTFKDNSTNAFTVTAASTTVKPVAVSPFTPSSYTNTEITTYGSGYFDGNGDYIAIPATPSTVLTGDFTVEAWIYPTVLNTNNMVFGSDNGTSSDYFNINSSSINFAISAPSSPNYPAWNYTFTVNQWYHVVLVRQSNTLSAFVNGIKLTLSSGSASESRQFFQSSVALLIGRYGYATNPWYFTGYISGARIVKGTALYTSNFVPQFTSPLSNVTNTQLLTLQSNGSHNNSTFKDSSSFNNLITRNGNATNGTFSPYGDNWSVQNAGNGNGLIAAYNSAMQIGTGQFTIEAWIYPTGTQSTQQTIFSNRTYNATGGGTFGFYINATTNTLKFDEVQTPTNITSSTLTVTPNTWQHVAITRDSNNYVRMFINGVLANSPVQSTFNFNSTNQFEIGFNNDVQHYSLIGYISNFRFVVGQALYTGAFTPATSPLTATAVGTSGANVASSITGKVALLACQSPSFINNSPVNTAVTLYGTPSVQKFSPFSTVTVPKYYSTKFDGTGDYITTPASTNNLIYYPAGTDFTMECWVYPTAAVAYQDIFGSYSGATSGRWILYTNTDGLTPVWYQYPSLNGSFTSGSGAMTLNAWNHIAIVRIGGTTKGYLNGVERLSSTATYDLDGGTASLYIGTGYTGRTMFNGYISNLRMVRDVGVYTGAFTPPSSPLTATQTAGTNIAAITGTQTVLLTCQSNTIVDNSTNLYTLTGNGDAKPLPVSPFTPTASSATSYSPTTFGGSMYFDGTGDYLTSPYNLGYELTSGDFTIELWVYRMASGVQHYLIHNRPTSSAVGWGTNITSTNTINFYFTGAGSLTGTSTVPINTWTHIAFCKSGTTLRIFNNGVLDVSSSTIGTGSVSTGTNLFIGCDNGPSFAGFFNGYMSDIKITKSALYTSNFYPGAAPLTPTTRLLLSGTSGGVIDATRTVDLETVADAKVTSFSPYNGSYYSNYSDGDADYLTVPSASWSTLAGTFTLEYWIRWNVAPASAGMITGVYTNGGLTCYNDGTRITPNIYGSGNIFNSTFLTASIVPGKWYHIAITRNSSNLMTMWVDGVSVGSTTTSTTFTQGTWYIFSFNNTNLIQGNISNLRVNNTCLYTTTFTPSTTPLTAIAGTQLLTCQSNSFKDNSTNAATLTPAGTVAVKSTNPFQVNTGQSYSFDGTGDYLTTPSTYNTSFGYADFTIEFWFYSIARTNNYPTLLTNDSTSTWAANYWAIYEGRTDSANKITFWVYNMDQINPVITSTASISVGQWYHVAFTRTGTSIKLYINGVLDKTSAAQAASLDAALAKPINVSSSATAAYNGYISDLRITKGVARTITVPTAPLTLK